MLSECFSFVVVICLLGLHEVFVLRDCLRCLIGISFVTCHQSRHLYDVGVIRKRILPHLWNHFGVSGD